MLKLRPLTTNINTLMLKLRPLTTNINTLMLKLRPLRTYINTLMLKLSPLTTNINIYIEFRRNDLPSVSLRKGTFCLVILLPKTNTAVAAANVDP